MHTPILARKEELSTLQDLLQSDRSEFLAMYGRRRIGKTFMIRAFFDNTENILFFKVLGLQDGSIEEQIANFMRQVSDTFFDGVDLTIPKSWNAVFDTLTKVMSRITDKKIVLFFDELPWMATAKSKLLQNLDYYWNLHWSSNPNIKLIVCGSSASWIINKIIHNKGGLHNRITREIHLSPFTLKETKEFLESKNICLNHSQIIAIYMLTGGIPFYLNHIEAGLSSAQIIEKLAFSKNSFLLQEFGKLFSSLFEKHEIYIEILRAIASVRDGVAQDKLLLMLDKSLRGKGGLEKLKELENADFILSFKPHFHKKRGVYYKLIDEYTLFYLQWIEPIKDTLQERDLQKGNWSELQNTPAWNSWCGYAFEAICYKHIFAIRKKLGLSPTAIANSWRYVPRKGSSEQGAQIDILFDRKDEAITLCEIKYTKDPFVITKDYADILHRKMTVFKTRTKTKKQLFMAMISANGLKNNPLIVQKEASEDFICGVVTLEDLFV
jgi:AAA+ ATPase superfamily predicted ATPase